MEPMLLDDNALLYNEFDAQPSTALSLVAPIVDEFTLPAKKRLKHQEAFLANRGRL